MLLEEVSLTFDSYSDTAGVVGGGEEQLGTALAVLTLWTMELMSQTTLRIILCF